MNFHQVFIILFLIKCWIKFQLWDENFRIYNLFQRKILHTDIDQGVNFRKLAKKYQNSKVGKMTFGALWLHSSPLCDATVRAGRTIFLWMYDDTQQNRDAVRTSTNEPWINDWSRNSLPLSILLSPSHRVCIWQFLVRYIVTGCIFCAPSGLRQGQVWHYHPPRHVPVTVNMEVPPCTRGKYVIPW